MGRSTGGGVPLSLFDHPSNRRGRRARGAAKVPPLELSEWGEAGPPGDYDPLAPTGPLPLGDVPAALASSAAPPEAAVPDAVVPGPAVPGTAVPSPEAAVPSPEAAVPSTEVAVPSTEVAAPETAAPEPAEPDMPAGGERATESPPARGPEQTPPGLIITDAPGQIGYPREVVPGAESVKRVSSGEGTQLPHWADPPTGEVPRALAGAPGSDDELQAWRLLGSRGLRWREEMSDWSDGPGMEDSSTRTKDK